MNVEIQLGPGSSAAKVDLQAGENLTAEGGSMIAMSSDMQITTTTHKKDKGGFGKALKRMLAGESFFMNHYTASSNGGSVFLAATLPGDMFVHQLNGEEKLIVQAGSYVASSEGIDIDMGWQGFKSFFSGESAFWLNLSGTGKVIINAFGAIYPVEVDGEYVVDTGHIVAFTEGLDFKVGKGASTWLSSIAGGEGLVCKFKGKGTVWCQSHSQESFGEAIASKLKPIKK